MSAPTSNDFERLIKRINDLVDTIEKSSSRSFNNGYGSVFAPFRHNKQPEYMDYVERKSANDVINMSKGERDAYRKKTARDMKDSKAYLKREEDRNDILSSRFSQTAAGKFARKHINLQQRIDDYSMMGKYMSANASKLGSAMFGNGKTGAAASKAIGTFGKGIANASKLLGKFAGPLGVAIQAIQLFTEGMTSHYEHQAKLTDFQRKSEEIQFNRSKELTLKEQEKKVESINFEADLRKKNVEVLSQNLGQSVGIQNKSYLAGHSARIGALMGGITDSAYSAAESSIDVAAEIQKFDIDKQIREMEQGMFTQSRTLKNEGKLNLIEAEKQEINANYRAQQNELSQDMREYQHETSFGVGGAVKMVEGFSADAHGRAVNPFTGENYSIEEGDRGNAAVGALVNNPIGQMLGADATVKAADKAARSTMNLDNQRMKQVAEEYKIKTQNEYELKQLRLDNENEITLGEKKALAEKSKAELDAAAQLKKQYLALAKQTESYMQQTQNASNSLAKSMGITSSSGVRNFEQMFNILGRDVFSKWGRNAEQAAALQSSYAETTGRNVQFSSKDYDKMFAVGNLLGDDGIASQLASTMEIFNHSAGQSMDMIEKEMQSVSQYGLNARKYSKDLLKNLQLANKYNFKGGTQGLMDMAKWAQSTRFNMDSLGSMLDKAQGGGIEGIITQSAGFQVLGGQAAMNSDPLGMLYDAYADPAAYAKRMQDMTKGFGKFNEKTGETEFNINESMQINQLAKLQGRSAEEIRNEIMDRNKRSRIEKELGDYNDFSDKEKTLIGSKAHLNENGEWTVTMENGEEKSVSSLSKEDLKDLMPETHDEAVEDYMDKILTNTDKIAGSELWQKFDVMLGVWDSWNDNVDERNEKSKADYQKNRDNLISNITEGMQTATKAYGNLIDVANKGNTAIDNASNGIATAAGNITATLNNLAQFINTTVGKLGGGTVDLQTPVAIPSQSSLTQNKGGNGDGNGANNAPTSFASHLSENRTSAKDWLKSSEGKEWNDDHYVKNAMGIMESLSGNKVDVDKLTKNFADIAGIGWFNLKEDGFRENDSMYDVIKNLRELYLQGHIDEKGRTLYNGKEVKHSDYLASDFGKMVEAALANASKYGDISGKSATSESGLRKRIEEGIASVDGSQMRDGFAGGNGTPMLLRASDVTPIQDGFAQSDPRDTALFAKPGGPFSRLFDGVFGQVSRIYEKVTGSDNNTHTLVIKGEIKLTGKDGQSVDIINTLKENPMFVKQITEMITKQISSNANGGRGEMFPNRFS